MGLSREPLGAWVQEQVVGYDFPVSLRGIVLLAFTSYILYGVLLAAYRGMYGIRASVPVREGGN